MAAHFACHRICHFCPEYSLVLDYKISSKRNNPWENSHGRVSFFSVILTVVYILVSFVVSSSISGNHSDNLYFLLISAPQIPLYIFAGVLEAILWAPPPEKASFGFGVFEMTKVIIGGVTVAIFHLSLTGAILAITGARVIQVITTLYLARKEFTDKVSFQIISKMLRSGWVALLNQFGYFIANFDFLLVAVLAGAQSENLITYYAAALVFASVITYSNWIAYGLYAEILSGIDPKETARQVLELQYIFTVPMVIGEIILAYPLLHLFKQDYVQAVPILIILAVASAFNAFSLTFDNIITGSDRTDATDKADFSTYLKSKLFLVAKINIGLSTTYVLIVSILTSIFSKRSLSIFGYPQEISIGILWALAFLGMWICAILLKLQYVKQITTLSIPKRTVQSILAGSISFGFVLYILSKIIVIHGGSVLQALYILLMGGSAIAVYASIILASNPDLRKLTKYAITSLFNH